MSVLLLEIDVGAGECALNDYDDKAITDEGKLARETKDALDEIIKLVPEDLNDTTCWGMQIAGSHCTMTSIHLDSQGIYVNMHRHSFNIPSSHYLLENFGPAGALLLSCLSALAISVVQVLLIILLMNTN
ncbi:hypothetical protein G6F42_022839 [Rhizopus arrhizus]|nr:hypothetical protein G6F42_022839 [Rhizopus arrhizus]